MLNLLLLALSSIEISGGNTVYDLVKPGYYHNELQMTGGQNCTSIYDCGSRVCDSIVGDQKVCICYTTNALPDCSYDRVPKTMLPLIILPALNTPYIAAAILIIFAVGYDINGFAMF